jgi:hypothetical protein
VHISPPAKLPQLSDNISVLSFAESTSSYQQTEHGGEKTARNSQVPAVILRSMVAETEGFRGQRQPCWL